MARKHALLLPLLLLMPACSTGYAAFKPVEGVEYNLYDVEREAIYDYDFLDQDEDGVIDEAEWSAYVATWEERYRAPVDGRYHLNYYGSDYYGG